MLRVGAVLAFIVSSQFTWSETTYYFKQPVHLQALKNTWLALPTTSQKLAELQSLSGPHPIKPYRVFHDQNSLQTALDRGDITFMTPLFLRDNGSTVAPTQTIFVKFRTGVTREIARLTFSKLGLFQQIEENYGGMSGVYKIHSQLSTGSAVLQVAETLTSRDDVEFAEPDMIFQGHAGLDPNDPGYVNSWALKNSGQFSGSVPGMDTRAFLAWNQLLGSPTVQTLIIDVGVQQNHPDINQVAGRDFTSDGNALSGGPVNSFDNHGTAVAGCVSATINNAIGSSGLAPGTKSVSARTFISTDSGGSWTANYSWTADALAWATSQGIRVTNNSNIYGSSSAVVTNAYTTAFQNGLLSFACAGNNGSSTLSYPASLTTVEAVASINSNGLKSSFSQYGTGLDFSAPGSSIYSTDRTGSDGYVGGDFAYVSGTSFASPLTAAVAALIWSANPGLTNSEVLVKLQNTSYDLGAAGYDTTYGYGLVRADWAIEAAQSQSYEVTPMSMSIERGVFGSGNVTSVADFDNDKLIVKKGFVANLSDPPVRIAFESYQPLLATPSALFTITSKVSAAGLKQTVEIYNWTSNSYVSVDSAGVGMVEATYFIPLGTTTDIVDPISRHVRYRLSYKPTSFVSASTWQAEINRCTLSVSQ